MTKAEANGRLRPLPDYLRRGLKLVFVGFNPGLRSARLGHYYAGRGNQFWPFLSRAGLTRQPLSFADDQRLLEFDMGLTDLVKRPTQGVSELTAADYRRGRGVLRAKIRRYRPQVLAFVGKGVYEQFVGRRTELGPQKERLFGAGVFVLPSTSAANATVSRPQKLRYFRQLARWLRRLPLPA